jgi:serine/threonine protein kinase
VKAYDPVITVRLTEARIAQIASDCLEAVKFVHSKGIMYVYFQIQIISYSHRDVKADNFVYATKQMDSRVVLIDLGFAKEVKKGEKLTQICGTARFAYKYTM